MKKFIAILLLVFLFACEKDECNCNHENIIGKWEATFLLTQESVGYPKNNDYNPVVEFKNDNTVALVLDVNSCFGEFTLHENNGIEISNAGCTEICCDSAFSEKIVELLPQVTNFTIEGNELKLNIPGGWIRLNRVSG